MAAAFEALALNDSIVAALKKENIIIPTEVQQRVISFAVENRDILAQSGTGTGKTLAYLLPLFQKLNAAARETQALVLCPTHELAVQVMRQTELLSQNSGIKLTGAVIVGNVNIDRQILKLKEKPHIIAGTSGRILELIKKRKISAHTVKTIVLDEADRLLDESNREHVQAIIKSTLKDRQLMAFSATIPKASEAALIEMMKEPVIVKVEDKLSVPETLSHYYFSCEQRDKVEILRKLTRIFDPQRAIVFVSNQGNEIEIFSQKLKYHGIDAAPLHGAARKLDRKKAMEAFRSGKLQLLIASDLAARGLHIEGVTHIFNINIPEDTRDYVHRAGRSGRNGNTGLVVSIVTERELQFIRKFEKDLNIFIEAKDMYKGAVIDAKPVRSKAART